MKETPSMRMHVLVTGSLYLVGDMLRLLGKSTGKNVIAGGGKNNNSSEVKK